MFQLILPMLIFLSLGVMIFILAKYYPQLKQNNKQKAEELNEKSRVIKKKFFSFFRGVILAIRDFLVLLAEKTVKKTKELLYLVHFWLIKIKKKSKNGKKGKQSSSTDDFLGEIEAKEELIREEEKNLDKIIHEDLGSSQQDDFIEEARKKIEERQALDFKKEEKKEQADFNSEAFFQTTERAIDKTEREEFIGDKKTEDRIETRAPFIAEDKIESQAESFFSEKESKIESTALPEETALILEEKTKAKKGKIKKILGFPGRILKIFSRKKKAPAEEDKQASEENYYEGDEFSDGIVKIEEYKKPLVEEKLLIKEVVKIDKGRDLDEEIGVDRQILEKKLINKIVQNPKQVENYRQLGELYVKMENYAEASECYQQILKIRTRDADAKRKMEKIKLLRRIKR